MTLRSPNRVSWSALALALAACGTSRGDVADDPARCERLRDHVISLRLEAMGSTPDVEQHRAALEQTLGAQLVGGCQGLRTAERDCALAARDLGALAACDDHDGSREVVR